jgi:large subunit ribosomal protein L25
MSTGFELQFETRAALGTSGNRRLRREGRVPAIVYGAGRDPRPISLDQNSLFRHMERQAFFTSIITLSEGQNSQPVIVKHVHFHPVKRQILHMDFQRILEDEKITLDVPIRFIGEAASKGVKLQGGEIAHLLTEIEVSCLPKDLPEFIEFDVTELELNQLVHLSSIKPPEGVEFVALSHGQDPAVIAINPPRREEEEQVAEALVPEVPAEAAGEAAPAEPTED